MYAQRACSCTLLQQKPVHVEIIVERLFSAPLIGAVWAGLPCNMCLWCVAAEPRHNVYPAVVGAAIGGMLFAAIVTVLLLVFIIRNRHNNPRKSEQASSGFVSGLALTLCVFSTRATWYAVWFVSICVAQWEFTLVFQGLSVKVNTKKNFPPLLLHPGSTASQGKTSTSQRMRL